MRQCEVYLHDIRAGLLTEEDNGEYIFVYEPSYVADEEPYRSPYLFAVFFNMLSEGENRRIQSRLLHIDSSDDFGILLATAQNDTVGAITVKPIEP